jgi:hypothetical protein
VASPQVGERYFDHDLGIEIIVNKSLWEAVGDRYIGNVAYHQIAGDRWSEMQIERWLEKVADGRYERLPE